MFLKHFSGQRAEDPTVVERAEFINETINFHLDIWAASKNEQRITLRKNIQKYISELKDIAGSGG